MVQRKPIQIKLDNALREAETLNLQIQKTSYISRPNGHGCYFDTEIHASV